MFYYVKNLQGDIVKILDEDGNEKASCVYNAWGDILSQSNDELSSINPLRYRGYVYDTDTGLYYLQSRYYDPKTGRFINADDTAYIGSSGTAIGDNIYAYCENDPVNNVDYTGQWFHSLKTFKLKISAKQQEVENYKAMGYRTMYFKTVRQYARLEYLLDCVENVCKTNKNIVSRFNSYIYGQSDKKYGTLLFGKSTVKNNGCVSIAIYNALFRIGKKQSLTQIIVELIMNECLIDDGFGGVNYKKIGKYLSNHNINFKKYDSFNKKNGKEAYKNYKKNSYKYRASVVSINGHAFCIIKDGKKLKMLNYRNEDRCAKAVDWNKIKSRFIAAFCIK